MSTDISLFLIGKIECLDCFAVCTVEVPAYTDSRNTVIAKPNDTTIPDGWVKIKPDWYSNDLGKQGYRCSACKDKA